MKKYRAVFLDRDGVINSLVHKRGAVDSPFSARQFKLLPGAGMAIRKLNRLGVKVAVVSNQPGVAKGNFTAAALREMTEKMERGLGRAGARVDGVYYCLHHPQALLRRYRSQCRCRKPKPGLLLQAAKELTINLRQSFMVGDNLTDIEAGKAAGCATIFVGSLKCDQCRFMRAKKAMPDYIAADIMDAVRAIQKHFSGRR
ncbi:MAG: HAD family hydrolase [Candidatus Aureabacteria bacterium]|nr:HAD family hydrolase [Candidatus Auribacterota bacterium]